MNNIDQLLSMTNPLLSNNRPDGELVVLGQGIHTAINIIAGILHLNEAVAFKRTVDSLLLLTQHGAQLIAGNNNSYPSMVTPNHLGAVTLYKFAIDKITDNPKEAWALAVQYLKAFYHEVTVIKVPGRETILMLDTLKKIEAEINTIVDPSCNYQTVVSAMGSLERALSRVVSTDSPDRVLSSKVVSEAMARLSEFVIVHSLTPELADEKPYYGNIGLVTPQ